MTDREENKLNMYRAVLNLLQENEEKTGAIPAFTTVTTALDEAIKNIEKQHTAHQTVAKGTAQQKEKFEEQLIDSLVTLAGVLYVYAVQQKNEELKTIVKVTESQLKRMRDNELLARAHTIYERAQTLQAELADYGIGEARLNDVSSQIGDYGAALGKRETVSAEKTAARQALSDAFEQTDNVLYEMLDPLMETYRTGERDFYNAYQSARVIKDLR